MVCTGNDRSFDDFSKLFITCDVNATGRKFLGLAGRDFLGTGMTIDVFHRVGTLCKLREAWKMEWKIPYNGVAQFLKT